jgi:CRISPR/Cas system CSM-associated protein Csm5 (group 7 of RAMP superfamily)
VNGKKSYRKTAEGDYIVPMHEHDIHVLFDALDAYREFVFNTYSYKQHNKELKDMDYLMKVLTKEVQHIRNGKCIDCTRLEDMKYYNSSCYEAICYERRNE